MRLSVITESSGKVIAAVHATSEQRGQHMTVGLSPLEGQTIAEVDAPEHLLHLEATERLQRTLGCYLTNGKLETRTGDRHGI